MDLWRGLFGFSGPLRARRRERVRFSGNSANPAQFREFRDSSTRARRRERVTLSENSEYSASPASSQHQDGEVLETARARADAKAHRCRPPDDRAQTGIVASHTWQKSRPPSLLLTASNRAAWGMPGVSSCVPKRERLYPGLHDIASIGKGERGVCSHWAGRQPSGHMSRVTTLRHDHDGGKAGGSCRESRRCVTTMMAATGCAHADGRGVASRP
jgi:hypothetical protein